MTLSARSNFSSRATRQVADIPHGLNQGAIPLLKAGLVHFERSDYVRAEEFYLQAWGLLGGDEFARWRWHIPLLHARGALALARGRHEEGWRFAAESLELARQTYARKHEARAQLLQGEIPCGNRPP
jgi:hypothetical protein